MAKKKEGRVTVTDRAGNIAKPLKKDLDAWLAKGWTIKDGSAESAESPSGDSKPDQPNATTE